MSFDEMQTLTDFEVRGLASHANLADGHAYQDLGGHFTGIVTQLRSIWATAAKYGIPETNDRFKKAFARLAQSETLGRSANYTICPTASNSIDIVAAFLKECGRRTALIEPTFDNLALLLKRRRAPVMAIPEEFVFDADRHVDLLRLLRAAHCDTLFVVNPNNPTGKCLSREAFEGLAIMCANASILLIIDSSFRFYNRSAFDDYGVLEATGVSFLMLEDTGKVFPTLDMKASLLSYSTDNRDLIEEIYKELYLCSSAFALAVLTEFLDVTSRVGLGASVWTTVDKHRDLLRNAIAGSQLVVAHGSAKSTLSVEWLACHETGKHDLEICSELIRRGLAVLPGRLFYWASADSSARQAHIRISLMKPERVVAAGLERLRAFCQSSSTGSPAKVFELGASA
jgi:aspartate/methionine/tyrosine aminotransferase